MYRPCTTRIYNQWQQCWFIHASTRMNRVMPTPKSLPDRPKSYIYHELGETLLQQESDIWWIWQRSVWQRSVSINYQRTRLNVWDGRWMMKVGAKLNLFGFFLCSANFPVKSDFSHNSYGRLVVLEWRVVLKTCWATHYMYRCVYNYIARKFSSIILPRCQITGHITCNLVTFYYDNHIRCGALFIIVIIYIYYVYILD